MTPNDTPPPPLDGDSDTDNDTDTDSDNDNGMDEQHPEHDSKNPELEDQPTPDEPPGAFGGDDDLKSGQYE